MYKVKIFSGDPTGSTRLEELEKKINEWIEETGIRINSNQILQTMTDNRLVISIFYTEKGR